MAAVVAADMENQSESIESTGSIMTESVVKSMIEA
jgi:hypothetical protein